MAEERSSATACRSGPRVNDLSPCLDALACTAGSARSAERFASPFAWARNTKPKRSANAAAGTICAPLPDATTTCVLSIMQVAAVPVTYPHLEAVGHL